jgi:hypothetical protein
MILIWGSMIKSKSINVGSHMQIENDHKVEEIKDAESSVARRQLFTLGLFGIVGTIASSCSSSTGILVGQAFKRSKSPVEGNGEGEAFPETLTPEVLDTACSATTTKAVSVSTLVEMTADRAPLARFYGNSGSLAMLAVKIRDVDTEKLLVTTEAGRNLALHVLGEADRAPAGGFRPITIDGLKLVAGESIRLISTIKGKSESSIVKVEFMTKFDGKDIVDLSNFSSDYNGNQFVAKFGDQSGFKASPNLRYPGDVAQGERPLVSAQQGAKWTLNSDFLISDLVITDMVGAVLKEKSAFNFDGLDILEHQSFCVYRYALNGKVYRTMIRVG